MRHRMYLQEGLPGCSSRGIRAAQRRVDQLPIMTTLRLDSALPGRQGMARRGLSEGKERITSPSAAVLASTTTAIRKSNHCKTSAIHRRNINQTAQQMLAAALGSLIRIRTLLAMP